MNDVNEERNNELSRTLNDLPLSRRLSSVGWGLLLVWIGTVMLVKLPTGAGLLGIGIITLAIQGARKFYSLPLEGFWVVAGLILTVSGLLNLSKADLSLLPVLLIAAGILFVFLGLRRKGRGGKGNS